MNHLPRKWLFIISLIRYLQYHVLNSSQEKKGWYQITWWHDEGRVWISCKLNMSKQSKTRNCSWEEIRRICWHTSCGEIQSSRDLPFRWWLNYWTPLMAQEGGGEGSRWSSGLWELDQLSGILGLECKPWLIECFHCDDQNIGITDRLGNSWFNYQTLSNTGIPLDLFRASVIDWREKYLLNATPIYKTLIDGC